MERNNPKQLKLFELVGKDTEDLHRKYCAVYNTNMTFRAFGNLAMRQGLGGIAGDIKKKTKPRKRRRING